MEPKFWQGLCDGLNRNDLKSKMWVQGEEKEKVFKEFENEFLKKTQEEWIEIFKNYDTYVSPVKNYFEACDDPQIQARNMIVKMPHPVFSEIQNLASPIKISRTLPTIRSLAPKTGQQTEEILKSLNYTEKDIETLKKNKII